MNFDSLRADLNHSNEEEKILCISTTAGFDYAFKELPPKTFDDYKVLSYLINDRYKAQKLLKEVDGYIKKILIDIEKKQPINLWKIATETISNSELISVKLNDVTLEAVNLLVKNLLNNNFTNSKVLVYGAGNLGSKLSLRLAESNCQVYLLSRAYNKVEDVSKAFNQILPSHSKGRITSLKNIDDLESKVDGIVSFVSAEKVVPAEYAEKIVKDEKGFAIDGGINNFSQEFLQKAHNEDIRVIRADVRLGTPYLLLPIFLETEKFFSEVQGKKSINGVDVVAGGIIGSSGDIVVDRIKNPNKVIGVANGYGGLKDEPTRKDRERIEQVKASIQSN